MYNYYGNCLLFICQLAQRVTDVHGHCPHDLKGGERYRAHRHRRGAATWQMNGVVREASKLVGPALQERRAAPMAILRRLFLIGPIGV